MFQDSFLHLLQSVMILVQNLFCSFDIDVGLAGLVPRKLQNRFDIGPAHVGIRTHGRHFGKTLDFLSDLRIRLFFQLQLIQLLQPLSRIVILAGFPSQFVLHYLNLFPKVILLLASIHILHDLGLNLLRQHRDSRFAIQKFNQLFQPAGNVIDFQQCLFFIKGNIQILSDDVGEHRRILHVLYHGAGFRRTSGMKDFGILNEGFFYRPYVCFQFLLIICRQILRLHVITEQRTVLLVNILQSDPLTAFRQHPNVIRAANNLLNSNQHTGKVAILPGRIVYFRVSLGGHRQQTLPVHCNFNGFQRLIPTHIKSYQSIRKKSLSPKCNVRNVRSTFSLHLRLPLSIQNRRQEITLPPDVFLFRTVFSAILSLIPVPHRSPRYPS